MGASGGGTTALATAGRDAAPSVTNVTEEFTGETVAATASTLTTS